ncbi:signal recognition particle-docking protein FtsY [Chitinivibrio alkaliphilus]|uniref:Signal recognition particle receptor FtsY n=1 Tax=Chitinivibrio alkaliphilus ACht1 TaxID=1313304 RepID=U7D8K5_9BACT|nr:signal recognition particle-docking protein FtsY [Chitinivibrio alkaliphilus]ERP39270.1 signal recognition particle-docking protein FtsY [Chitinivibrio alkaliphilus ACht1]
MKLFARLKDGLSKTRNQISEIVEHDTKITEEFYESLEDALIAADVGADITMEILDKLRSEVELEGITGCAEAYETLKHLLSLDMAIQKEPDEFPPKPWTTLVIGVNGVGKTTTIGKLAHEYRQRGSRVLLSAADTFRAGAIEQLQLWAERAECEIITQGEGADAASVVYDSMEAAKKRGADVMLIDTAGRLHNKGELMKELGKIVRVLKKSNPWTPNEVFLVVDATTGQNAIKQAEVFNELIEITGFIITKLDGTSKGGIALSLTRTFNIPVKKIGVGEGLHDLQDFDPKSYIDAMFGDFSV